MASLEKKQGLLRHQILEGGLNAEEFIEYLGTIKGQGENVDLDNWTFIQLEKSIATFKAKRQKNKNDLMNSRMSLNIIKKSKIFESILKKQKVFYENSQLWDFEINELQDCSKSDVNLLIPEEGQAKVKVEKYEIKSVGGFIFGIGSRNQLHLSISTNFSEGIVQRKSEDVDWLRKILMVDYPGYYLPFLEEDRELNSDDTKGISSRIAEIEGFLNKIMKFTPFQYSRHVHVFFEEHNLKKFTQFRNREALLEIVRDPDTLETPTGTIMVEISEKMNKVLKSTSNLGQDFNSLYRDLLNCSYKISGYMDKLKKQIGFLYNITSKLGEKYGEVQQVFKLEESKLPTIFEAFSNISSNAFRNLERNMKAFNDLTEGWTRDLSRDWGEFVNHDVRVHKEHKKYLYQKEYLLRRKEKHVSELLKWQLPEGEYLSMKNKDLTSMTKQQKFQKMFPNDTQIESRQRIWLAGMNQNYVQSFKAFMKEQEGFLLEKYLPYSGEAACSCKDMMNNYEEFNKMIFG